VQRIRLDGETLAGLVLLGLLVLFLECLVHVQIVLLGLGLLVLIVLVLLLLGILHCIRGWSQMTVVLADMVLWATEILWVLFDL